MNVSWNTNPTSSIINDHSSIMNVSAQESGEPDGTGTVAPGHQAVSYIETPGPHDVLLGRGGAVNATFGNRQYRAWVSVHKQEYNNSLGPRQSEKVAICRKVMSQVAAVGGRFLRRDESGGWKEITHGDIMKKVSQALREGGPKLRKDKPTAIAVRQCLPPKPTAIVDQKTASKEAVCLIQTPSMNDVLVGNGAKNLNHAGNRQCRAWVAVHEQDSAALCCHKVITKVNAVGGRFLRPRVGIGGSLAWEELAHDDIIKLVSKAIRNVRRQCLPPKRTTIADPKTVSTVVVRLIQTPSVNDVLVGNRVISKNHAGNRQYRAWVAANKRAYSMLGSTPDAELALYLKAISQVAAVGGRFLRPMKRDDESGGSLAWTELAHDEIMKMLARTLRERGSKPRSAGEKKGCDSKSHLSTSDGSSSKNVGKFFAGEKPAIMNAAGLNQITSFHDVPAGNEGMNHAGNLQYQDSGDAVAWIELDHTQTIANVAGELGESEPKVLTARSELVAQQRSFASQGANGRTHIKKKNSVAFHTPHATAQLTGSHLLHGFSNLPELRLATNVDSVNSLALSNIKFNPGDLAATLVNPFLDAAEPSTSQASKGETPNKSGMIQCETSGLPKSRATPFQDETNLLLESKSKNRRSGPATTVVAHQTN